jgi:hypothetical protein
VGLDCLQTPVTTPIETETASFYWTHLDRFHLKREMENCAKSLSEQSDHRIESDRYYAPPPKYLVIILDKRLDTKYSYSIIYVGS